MHKFRIRRFPRHGNVADIVWRNDERSGLGRPQDVMHVLLAAARIFDLDIEIR